VIAATLNEEANIDHVLDTALRSTAVVEVIIADGGSHDATVQKVLERAKNDPRVSLLNNPDRGQAAGLNQAAQHATGSVLIRLDGHTRYADDYVSSSLEAWKPGVAVGGPMLAEGTTAWTQATAGAMRDSFAVGPAKFRHANHAEDVDTVYLGTFEREHFLAIGGYRTFPSGTVEDTDLYARWRANGGSVRVDPSITCWYQPRDSWTGLVRQYFRYGMGKGELVWLNGRLPSKRPLAPAILVSAAGVCGLIGIAWTWVPLGVLVTAWAGVLAIIAARATTHRVRTAVVAATMHLTYGSGLWWGIVKRRPEVRTLGMSENLDVN
jgi:glycosyltransferase involved in cell wall biosynthesis